MVKDGNESAEPVWTYKEKETHGPEIAEVRAVELSQ